MLLGICHEQIDDPELIELGLIMAYVLHRQTKKRWKRGTFACLFSVSVIVQQVWPQNADIPLSIVKPGLNGSR
jgi:hypothetical protein